MCTSPMRIFYTGLKTETGKDKLVFDSHYPCPDIMSLERAEKLLKCRIPYDPDLMHYEDGHLYLHKTNLIPCGNCDQCRMSNAKKWAYRILMEIGQVNLSRALFVTLTFDDAWCPQKVDRKDVSRFMKRLRRAVNVPGIRFFACGEYGENGGRPHYHLILWNMPEIPMRPSLACAGSMESPLIQEIWPFGIHNIEPVTIRSIAYVARYTAKKTDAKRGFIAMSTHPGIGRAYIESHQSNLDLDYFPLSVDGTVLRVNPPRYCEKVLPDIDWKKKKEFRIWNADRSLGMLGYFHGLFGERLDNYMRSLYSARADRLAKKGV